MRGTVEQVLFRNPTSGWTIVRLAQRAGPTFTAVGPLPTAEPGHDIELTGHWETNPKYGRQFRAEHGIPVTPQTQAGIRDYLASALVDGVGPALAERMVAKFGTDTLQIIEKTPERLTEVSGIGAVRAERIKEALASQLGLQSTMVFLYGLGIPAGLASRIHRRYGGATPTVVQTEPFRLALDVPGVGFATADRVAARTGVDRNSPQRAQAAMVHALAEAAHDGHVFLPRPALFDATRNLLGNDAALDEALDALRSAEHVVCPPDAPEAVYAPPMYDAESRVVADLCRIAARRADSLTADPTEAISAFEAEAGLTLAPAQRDALVKANTARVLVITGGPGTGKTTIVRGVLYLLQQAKLRIQLAAPTGRAAKRMTEATGLEAKTLHRLLAYDPNQHSFVHGPETPLTADALIIDEMSMVDIALMAAFASAVADQARLVLVGDVDQLPSVGPGQVLRDLIESERLPVARLDRVFRQKEGSRITDNAHRINHGQFPEFDGATDGLSDFYLIERDDAAAAQDVLLKVVAERIPKRFGFDPFESIQVLTPMHRGELGAQVLNAKLQAHLNPDGASLRRGETVFRLGDKVMQTKNNYDLGVYNGDIGRLVFIDERSNKLKVAFEDREVVYEQAQQDALVLAYAMSIHKSQGSEYPAVVIPLSMQHYVLLHRNLLYTAVTRGKRLVVLVGSRRAMRTAIERERNIRRHSGLKDRLRDVLKPLE